MPSGSVTIHGANLVNGGAPIVDFGGVASIGPMNYSSTVTATIPPSVSPGTVNVRVTTTAGTSAVSAADLFTYRGTAVGRTAITSGAHDFSAGTAGVFDVTTTGTPDVSSITDAGFAAARHRCCRPASRSSTPADRTPRSKGIHNRATAAPTRCASLPPTASRRGDPGLHVDGQRAGGRPRRLHRLRRRLPPPTATGWSAPTAASSASVSAQFHGSTGSLHLQRPVVGITPTADRGGYWLVASDGGIFAFGDAGFHGSIPGAGLAPPARACPTA